MVDSDPGSVQILHSSLGSKDYRIVRAANANDSFERIKSRRVDLLVLSLPSADALELCKRVRSQPSCARLPIVFLLDEARDRQLDLHARQAGAEEVCSHSIDSRDFAARLQNLLRLAEVNRGGRLFHHLPQSHRLFPLSHFASTLP